MIGAILTTFLFALSAISGQRTAFTFGALHGNFWRLVMASAALVLLTLSLYPESLHPRTFGWLFFSGLIGFGMGDVALFMAYERLGSRLTILINFCLAPVFAAVAEYFWLGTVIAPPRLLAAAVVLTGVALALCGRTTSTRRHGSVKIGAAAAVVAGLGQGLGAVISRHAHEVEANLGLEINGISEACQRVLAGLLVAFLTVLFIRRPARLKIPGHEAPSRKAALLWLAAAALAGPVVGVSCFQWALESLESAIVLAIVSTTPILLMPLAWLTEKDKPAWLSVVGGVVAVAGVVWLQMIKSA